MKLSTSFALIGLLLMSLPLPVAAQERLLPLRRSSSGGGGAYTPPQGSAERTAIMNAMRRDVGRMSNLYVIFVVRHLRVHRGWAFAATRPRSSDESRHYEDYNALLHKTGSGWRVVGHLDGDQADNTGRLRRRFPQAPSDIF